MTNKIFTAAAYIIIITFFVWLFASWVDVMAHQTSGGTENAWNIFLMIVNHSK